MYFKYFKVLGERCSGTNYITTLIKTNFPSLEYLKHTWNSPLGWKHALYDPQYILSHTQLLSHTLIICVVRDPYDWLRSLYLQPHHAEHCKTMDFSTFLDHEWRSYDYTATPQQDVDFHPSGRFFKNILEMRSEKQKGLLQLCKDISSSILVSYESVAHDPEAFCGRIGERYFSKHIHV